MEPRLSVVTLGVRDLERSLAFYRDGLGWPAREFDGTIAFLELSNVVIVLFGRDDLATDANVELGTGHPPVALAHNVRTGAEVDDTMRLAARLGARVTQPAVSREWGGYSGYFADPDGHLWEVAYNPDWHFGEAEAPRS